MGLELVPSPTLWICCQFQKNEFFLFIPLFECFLLVNSSKNWKIEILSKLNILVLKWQLRIKCIHILNWCIKGINKMLKSGWLLLLPRISLQSARDCEFPVCNSFYCYTCFCGVASLILFPQHYCIQTAKPPLLPIIFSLQALTCSVCVFL